MDKKNKLKNSLFGQFNFAWCIIFLKNSGERARAIMLAKDALGVSLMEASEWVNTVAINRRVVSRESNRKLHAEYPASINKEELRDFLECEISHWPKKT
jgi:hypothetical protein